jgi:hypothetical protein
MICVRVEPNARAASTTPRGTSSSAASSRRATNGIAAMVSGTIAAVAPIDVPVMSRDSGMTSTSRITKGSERPMFTTAPSARYADGRGPTPLGCQVTRRRPRPRPKSWARSADGTTIHSVCSRPSRTRRVFTTGSPAPRRACR